MVAAVAAAATHLLEDPHLTKIATKTATPKEDLLRSLMVMRLHQILDLNQDTTQDRNHHRNQAGSDRMRLPEVRMRTQDRTQGDIQTQDRIQGAIQKLDRVQEDIKIQTQGRTQILMRMQMRNQGGKRRAKKPASEKRSVKSPRLYDKRKRRMRSG